MFVSGGSLVAKGIQWPAGQQYYAGQPTDLFSTLNGGYWGAYGALYEQQLWVYTVVNKRASLLSNLPLKTYARGEGADRQERADSPLARLLRNPMPGMSSLEWWLWVASTEDIYGEAFVWKRRDNGGRPFQLVPLHPTCVHRNGDDTAWYYDNGSTRLDLPDADLIHFKRFSPSSSRRGLSPLEPLRRTLENEDASRRATSAFWRNGARPAFVLKHPGQLSATASVRLKTQFDAQKSGADNTGSTLVLEEGMEAAPLSLSAEEAQYIESRKLNREEVVAAYDIAPPAVHILDRATFSNITEQFRSVYRDTIGPWAHRFESVLQVQLVPDFEDDDIYLAFNMDEVLRGEFETRQGALAQAKHYTVAEKRRIDNLPYIEGTDVVLVNTADQPLSVLLPDPDAAVDAKEPTPIFGYDLQYGIATIDERRAQLGLPAMPGGAGSRPPTPPGVVQAVATDPTVDAAQAAEAVVAARTIAGRLSWQKTLGDVDPVALTADLNGSTEKVLAALAAAKHEGLTVAAFRDRVMSMVKE